MQKLFVFIFFYSFAHAASITVKPFEMEFTIDKGYEVQGEMELSCRYEKFVWGDSAEYVTFYQEPTQLKVNIVESTDYNTVQVKNTKNLYYEYDEFFRSNEECRASFKIFFISTKYALGHGRNPKEPVKFTLWKGFYDYQEDEQIYDLRKLAKYIDNTVYSFREKSFENRHINIWILQDGREARTNPWVERAVINPATGVPYKPELN